ncbi:hypothetical protein K525DRAFT_204776 [Schizophyllum commune Loenen D]|nr:hypothetical protein K525DRAFT_204776 [Schizophyllum commune Loenen D]
MRASTTSVLLWGLLWARVQAEVLQAMQQSWRFDFYDDSGNITTTDHSYTAKQCQSMHVKWGRSSATGPSATAPYSFLIYTSIYQFPFFLNVGNSLSYDFEIPFPPGTQMQICMFDANGYTGGCQSVVSIVPNTTALSRTCTNETLSWPEGPLDVEAGDNQGPLSWTAWPEQVIAVILIREEH